MNQNEFIPGGLTLISDNLLFKTIQEYRRSHSLLISNNSPASRQLKSKLDQALRALEEELERRGLSVSPDSNNLRQNASAGSRTRNQVIASDQKHKRDETGKTPPLNP